MTPDEYDNDHHGSDDGPWRLVDEPPPLSDDHPLHPNFIRSARLRLWGEGPWVDEPDRVEWRERNFPCLIVRNHLGALCGYVGVPPNHPWHGLGYDGVPVEAHGGLTWAGLCSGHICHVAQPGEPDNVWWLGFDCSHYCDLTPGLLKGLEGSRSYDVLASGTYRDIDYVRSETDELAEQCLAEPGWLEYLTRRALATSPRKRKQAEVYIGLYRRRYQRRRERPRV